jgi:hypothetical protein
MPYNMETYGYGTSAGTINLGQVSMPYNMETYGYQQPHVAPYQQPPAAPYQQPSVLPVPVPVTQHVMAPTLHQFRFYEENVTVFGGQQHMYEPAPWAEGAKKAFTVWQAERQKQEKEWQARMVKEYLGYHPELQEKLEIEYGLPGQIPGQIPGQLPGQFPGQIPGQLPGPFPGQIPGQFPSAASLPGGNPSLAETVAAPSRGAPSEADDARDDAENVDYASSKFREAPANLYETHAAQMGMREEKDFSPQEPLADTVPVSGFMTATPGPLYRSTAPTYPQMYSALPPTLVPNLATSAGFARPDGVGVTMVRRDGATMTPAQASAVSLSSFQPVYGSQKIAAPS